MRNIENYIVGILQKEPKSIEELEKYCLSLDEKKIVRRTTKWLYDEGILHIGSERKFYVN